MGGAEVSIRGQKASIIGVADVNVTDRVARILGQLTDGVNVIDPRDRNWDLNFATDQVDVSGSTVISTISGTPDVNVTDRADRLLGITYGSQGQQILQRAATNELLVQLRNAGVDIDPRDRNWDLNFATDQVDVSGSTITSTISGTPDVNVTDRVARLLGITYGSQGQQIQQKAGTFELLTDPTDRATRLLGITYGSQGQQLQQRGVTFDLLTQLRTGGVEYDASQIRALTFATDSVDTSGSSVSISGTPSVDVTDRSARLLGITYGSQGAQLQQRLGTLELLVQLRNASIDIDPTQIRPLTFATDSVNVSGSAVTVTNVPTTPINDFNTCPNVASESSSTHTYTATGNFKLTSIQASASGAMKIEVKTGASGSEMAKMVAYITESNLTIQLEFHEEIQITIGQRIQVIRTNREKKAMDVFSTILGFNN